jgi:hypothetical protein
MEGSALNPGKMGLRTNGMANMYVVSCRFFYLSIIWIVFYQIPFLLFNHPESILYFFFPLHAQAKSAP